MDKTKNNYSKLFNILFFFLATLVIGYVIYKNPLISDDIYFNLKGFDNLHDIFKFSIDYGNGRVLGNSFIQLLVKNNIVRVVVQTLFIMAMPLLVFLIAKKDEKDSLLIPLSIILFASPELFSETYAWSSGFCNYVPPVVFALIIVLMLKKELKVVGNIVLFILGFSSQLFVETNSLVNVFLAFIYLFYLLKQKEDKNKLISAFVLFISMLLGFIIIMAIPFIVEPLPLVSEYRKTTLWLEHSSISSYIIALAGNVYSTNNCFFGDIPLLFITSIFSFKVLKTNLFEKIILIFVPLYSIYINYINPGLEGETVQVFLYLIVNLIYIFIIVYEIIKKKDLKKRTISLFTLVLGIMVAIPIMMTIIYSGGRLYLISLVLFAYAISKLIYFNKDIIQDRYIKIIKVTALISLIVISSYLVPMYKEYARLNEIRTNYVAQELKEEESLIIIPSLFLPYNPDNPVWGYKVMFNIPDEIKIISRKNEYWINNMLLEQGIEK